MGGATAATLPAWGFVNALSRLLAASRSSSPTQLRGDGRGRHRCGVHRHVGPAGAADPTAAAAAGALLPPVRGRARRPRRRTAHRRRAADRRALLSHARAAVRAAPASSPTAVCIGTDPDHTPGWLDAALAAFASWELAVDDFQGSVPQRHYRTDLRVASVMVEIRRDVYLEPGGGLLDTAFSRLHGGRRLAAATPSATGADVGAAFGGCAPSGRCATLGPVGCTGAVGRHPTRA